MAPSALAAQWQAMDGLVTAVRAYKHQLKPSVTTQDKRALLELVAQLNDTMPEQAWSQVGWSLREAQQELLGKKASAATCDRWKDSIRALRDTLVPVAVPYEKDFFTPPARGKTAKPFIGRTQTFSNVAKVLSSLVEAYEASPPAERQHFSQFAEAMVPYRRGTHLLRLAEMLPVSAMDKKQHAEVGKAIQGFLQRPEYQQWFSAHPDLVANLSSATNNHAIRIAAKHELKRLAAQDLLPAASDKGDYARMLTQALRRDIDTRYVGDSTRAIAENAGSEDWLRQIHNYRWAVAVDKTSDYAQQARQSFGSRILRGATSHVGRQDAHESSGRLPGF